MTSSLNFFSAFTSISGAGRPGEGFRWSKLKKDLISFKFILILVSTQKNEVPTSKMA